MTVQKTKCTKCGGKGRIVVKEKETCGMCDGTGVHLGRTCGRCGGDKYTYYSVEKDCPDC